MKTMRGVYRHYKGNRYVVHGEARHSETEEEFVLYCSEAKPEVYWVRPKTMFFETVTVDGQEQPRFELIEPAVDGDS